MIHIPIMTPVLITQAPFPTEVVEVLNPITGRIWMDRNLGATRAALSSTDAEAYGDSYQWGRLADGHEKRTSLTTTILSSTDVPGHGDFILSSASPFDWRVPQNDNLWQGVNPINDICPSGYRLPTDAELDAERLSWATLDAAGAFGSSLKIPVAGYRNNANGSFVSIGSIGLYWSTIVINAKTTSLYITSSSGLMTAGNHTYGASVRCIKD